MMRILLLPLLTFAMWGADLSGKWTGVADVQDGSGGRQKAAIQADLKQTGNTLSGTAGRLNDPQQEPLRGGVVNGKQVRFEVNTSEIGMVRVELTLVDADRLEGTLKAVSDAVEGKVTLTRSK